MGELSASNQEFSCIVKFKILNIIILIIYFCKLKKIAVWQDCYEDFFLDDEVHEIEDDKRALHVVSKIHKLIEFMRKHGETYSIQEIHPDYFDELNDFDHKLSDVETKLSRAQKMRDSLEYCEIKNDGMQLLKGLTRSKVMNDFSYHHSKTSINIQYNEVSFNWFKLTFY